MGRSAHGSPKSSPRHLDLLPRGGRPPPTPSHHLYGGRWRCAALLRHPHLIATPVIPLPVTKFYENDTPATYPAHSQSSTRCTGGATAASPHSQTAYHLQVMTANLVVLPPGPKDAMFDGTIMKLVGALSPPPNVTNQHPNPSPPPLAMQQCPRRRVIPHVLPPPCPYHHLAIFFFLALVASRPFDRRHTNLRHRSFCCFSSNGRCIGFTRKRDGVGVKDVARRILVPIAGHRPLA